ncbi:polysaccharide lyase family 7 protein [Trematosphaeria pertusa]|uniref:Polysaccharide lyase family 7 protein n=1 Tax=Trematosphaeria pertusa TaxID=390896 RepID=A0A6A6I3M9_9PLEO|nr:polysaccharide lyase family 7 protein [Trematosphaeria pertusa]KAF2244598.1 polysaccharide lyase family 7 protein [Trematosphaeria pertusa]
MPPSVQSALLLFLGLSLAAPFTPNPLIPRALSPSCAPGGNFDLSKFNLQLPTGTPGHVTQISSSKLKGCEGWQDSKHFHTSKTDGALIMKVPGSSDSSGCVTTPNSKHCRTELREANLGSWDSTASTNRLKVLLSVTQADDSKYGTVIGQVKVDDSVSKKPVAELFINKSGVLTIGVSQIPNKSSLEMTEVGKVKIGQKFSYELRYEKGKFSVVINGAEPKTLSTGQLKSPPSYFKVGNYNQGDSPSEVVFYTIGVQHS